MAALPFTGQRLLVVGLAREGAVAARWLAERGAQVLVSDVKPADQFQDVLPSLAALGVQVRLGPQTIDLLDGVDALIVSPGVPQEIPLLTAARERGIPLSSEPRLFAQQCPAPLIGVTGSSGKTTTTTLTARMLEASGFHTWLGGNIGAPLLADLDAIQPDDRVAMELSSFQLLYWRQQSLTIQTPLPWRDGRGLSPHVAAILNITPNHLDRHPSMAHYAAAKTTILAYQTADDIAVLSHDDPTTAAWAHTGRVSVEPGRGQAAVEFAPKARIVTFGLCGEPSQDGAWIAGGQIWFRHRGHARPILPISDIRLRGQHNLANVLAAVCLAAAVGAEDEAMAAAVHAFGGVEHRLEVVRRRNGVIWINDSIATSPERAVAALRSFEEPIILLAGGRDKHLPWELWAQTVHQRVRCLVTFGEAADLIERALSPKPAASVLQGVYPAGDLEHAVALAADLAKPGDVVLLAPGGTSYDAYVDFAARGAHFRALARALP